MSLSCLIGVPQAVHELVDCIEIDVIGDYFWLISPTEHLFLSTDAMANGVDIFLGAIGRLDLVSLSE